MKALYILFQQNRTKNIVLILISILFFASLYLFILNMTYKTNKSVAQNSFQGSNRYSLHVIGKDANMKQLYEFDEQLRTSSKVTQYNASPVDISIVKFSGGSDFTPRNKKETNSLSPVAGLQVNEIAHKLNEFDVETGRFFSKKEFKDYDTAKVMPVILGSKFFNLYDLGDTLQMEIFNEKVKVKIIGFVKSNETIVTPTISKQKLDYEVLIPAQHYTTMPAETNNFAKQSLLSSANSMLLTSGSKISVRDTMTEISRKSDFWSVVLVDAGGKTVSIFNTLTKADRTLVFGVFVVAFLLFIGTTIVLQIQRNQNNQMLYNILRNSGMSDKEILKYPHFEWIILLGIGIFVPLIPFFIISQMAFLQLALYIALSVVFAMLFLFIIKRTSTIK